MGTDGTRPSQIYYGVLLFVFVPYLTSTWKGKSGHPRPGNHPALHGVAAVVHLSNISLQLAYRGECDGTTHAFTKSGHSSACTKRQGTRL